jgi:hypothetical protein
VVDGLISLAAYVFLAGVVMVAMAAVPALVRRWPKLLLWGFLTAIGSFAIVGIATLLPRG